jgi:hypothetical protein
MGWSWVWDKEDEGGGFGLKSGNEYGNGELRDEAGGRRSGDRLRAQGEPRVDFDGRATISVDGTGPESHPIAIAWNNSILPLFSRLSPSTPVSLLSALHSEAWGTM